MPGIAVAIATLVIPLIAISGVECVEALSLAGFAVRSRTDAATILERDLRVAVVPDVAMLAPEDLESVLRDSGIAYDAFLDLLADGPTHLDGLTSSAVRRTGALTPS